MSESSPPKLSVVDPPSGSASEAPARAPERASGGRSWIAWLLLVVAVLFAWQWLSQLERAEALTAEVSTLEAALVEARAEIDAWSAHLGQVRGAVDGVAAQLGTLQALVSEAPRAAAPGAAADPASIEPERAGVESAERGAEASP